MVEKSFIKNYRVNSENKYIFKVLRVFVKKNGFICRSIMLGIVNIYGRRIFWFRLWFIVVFVLI